jgi:hypothetical protein
MAALTPGSIRLRIVALGALVLAAPMSSADVSVKLDSGSGFSVQDNSGAVERLRVDEATGNIWRNGALFVHTTGATSLFVGADAGNTSTFGVGKNTAFGAGALASNSTGYENSAIGAYALGSNTHGGRNVAFGHNALVANTMGGNNGAFGASALRYNTTGNANSAVGSRALYSNTTGCCNSAVGSRALYFNTTGVNNIAVGINALSANTTGHNNIAIGADALNSAFAGSGNIAIGQVAGANQTFGSDNIYLANTGMGAESNRIRIGRPGTGAGTHAATFIAGIRGATTANADAIPVLIDSDGQLGTVSSSRSVKQDIRDMGDSTSRLLDLRPVTFRYKQKQTLPSGGEVPHEYGLIAEEVAEVFPDLVVYDEQGRPFTVKYHEMAPMLLNEMKKQEHTIETQRQEMRALRQEHEREIAALATRLARVETRVVGASGPGR